MENPVLDDADDEVEMSFYEWIEASPFNGIIIGVTLSSLVFSVFLSLFLRCNSPADVQSNQNTDRRPAPQNTDRRPAPQNTDRRPAPQNTYKVTQTAANPPDAPRNLPPASVHKAPNSVSVKQAKTTTRRTAPHASQPQILLSPSRSETRHRHRPLDSLSVGETRQSKAAQTQAYQKDAACYVNSEDRFLLNEGPHDQLDLSDNSSPVQLRKFYGAPVQLEKFSGSPDHVGNFYGAPVRFDEFSGAIDHLDKFSSNSLSSVASSPTVVPSPPCVCRSGIPVGVQTPQRLAESIASAGKNDEPEDGCVWKIILPKDDSFRVNITCTKLGNSGVNCELPKSVETFISSLLTNESVPGEARACVPSKPRGEQFDTGNGKRLTCGNRELGSLQSIREIDSEEINPPRLNTFMLKESLARNMCNYPRDCSAFRHTRQKVGESRNNGAYINRTENDEARLQAGTSSGTSRQRQPSAARKSILFGGPKKERDASEARGGARRKIETICVSSSSSWSAVEEDLDLFKTCNEMTNTLKSDEERKRTHDGRQCLRASTLPYSQNDDDLVLMSSRPKNAIRPGRSIKQSRLPSRSTCPANRTGTLQGSANLLPGVRVYASKDDSSRKRKRSVGCNTAKDDRHVLGKTSNAVQSSTSSDDSAMSVLLYPNSNKKQSDEHLRITYRPRSAARLTAQPVPTFKLNNTRNQSQCCNRRYTTNKVLTEGSSRRAFPSKRDVNGNKLTPTNIFDCTAELREIIQVTMKDLERYNANVSSIPSKKFRKDFDEGGKVSYENQDSLVVCRSSYKSMKCQDISASGESQNEPQSGYQLLFPSISHWTNKDKVDISTESASSSTRRKSQSMPRRSSRVDRKQYDSRFRVKLRKSLKAMLCKGRNVSITSINSYSACLTLSRHSAEAEASSSSHTTENLKRSVHKSPCFYFMDRSEGPSYPVDNLLSNEHYVCLKGEYPQCLTASFTTKAKGTLDRSFDRSANYHGDDPISLSWAISDSDQSVELPLKRAAALLSLSGSETNKLSLSSSEDQNVRSQDESSRFRYRHQKSSQRISRKADVIVPKNSQTFFNTRKRPHLKKSKESEKHTSEYDDRCSKTCSFAIQPPSADSAEQSSDASASEPYDVSFAVSFRNYQEKPRFAGKFTATKSSRGNRTLISASCSRDTVSAFTTDTLSSHERTKVAKVKVSHLESASLPHLDENQSISGRYRFDRQKDADLCSNYNYQEIEYMRGFDVMETSPSVQISISSPFDMSQVCAHVEIDSNSVKVSGVNMKRGDSKLPIIIKSRNVVTLDEGSIDGSKLCGTTYTHRNGPNKKEGGAKYQQSTAKLMASPNKGQQKAGYQRNQEIGGKDQYKDKSRQRDDVQLLERYLYRDVSASVINSIAEVSEGSPGVSCSQKFRNSLETNRNEKSSHDSEKSTSESTAEIEAWHRSPDYVSAMASIEAVIGSEVGGKRVQQRGARAKTARGHTKHDRLELIRSRKLKIADKDTSKQKTQFVASELNFPESCARRAPTSEMEKRCPDWKNRTSVLESDAVVVTSSSHTYSKKSENIKVYQKRWLKEVDQSASDESGQGSVDVCIVERSQSTREIVVKKNYFQNRTSGKTPPWGSRDHAGDNGPARTSVDFDSEQISYMEIVPKQGKWRGLQLSEISEPKVASKLKENVDHDGERKAEAKESSTSKSSSELVCKLLILPSETASAETLSCLDIKFSSPRCSTRIESLGNQPTRKTVPSSKALSEPKHVNSSSKSGRAGPKTVCIPTHSRAEALQSERMETHQLKELEYGEPFKHQPRINLGNSIKNTYREREESQEKHACSQRTDIGVGQKPQSIHETVQNAPRPVARAKKRYTNKSVGKITSKSDTSIQSEVTKRHTLQQAVQTSFTKEVQKVDKDTLVILPEFTGRKIDHVCQTEMNEPPLKVDKHIQCPTLGSQAAIELMDLLSLIQTGKQYFTQNSDKSHASDPNDRVVLSGVRLDNCKIGCKRSPNRFNKMAAKPASEHIEGNIQMSRAGVEFKNNIGHSSNFSKGLNTKDWTPVGQKSQFGYRSFQRTTQQNAEISPRGDRPMYRNTLREDKPDATKRHGLKETLNEDFSKIHRTQQCLRSYSKNVVGHNVSRDMNNRIYDKKEFYESLSCGPCPRDGLKNGKGKNFEVRKLAKEKHEDKPASGEVNEKRNYRNHVHYEAGKNVKNKSPKSSPVLTENTRQSKPLQETELNKSSFCKHLTKANMMNYIANLDPDTKVSENELRSKSRGIKTLQSQEVRKQKSIARDSEAKIGRQTSRASSQIKSEVGSDRLDQLLRLDSGKGSVELSNTKSEAVNLKDFIEINRGHHLVTQRALLHEKSGRVLQNTETRTNSYRQSNFIEMGKEKNCPRNGPSDDSTAQMFHRETNAKESFLKPAQKAYSDVNKGLTKMNVPDYLFAPQAESKQNPCTKDEEPVGCQDKDSKNAGAKATSKSDKEIKIQINLNMMESRTNKDHGTPDTVSQDSMAFTPHRLKRLGRVGRLPVYQKRFLRRYESQVDKKLTVDERRSEIKAKSDQLKEDDQSPAAAAPAKQPNRVTTPEDTQSKRKQQTSSDVKLSNTVDVKNKKVMTSQTDSMHVVSQRKKADIYNTLLSALLLALKAPEGDWQHSKAGDSRHGDKHGTALIPGHRDESDRNEKASRGEKIINSEKPVYNEKSVHKEKLTQNEKPVYNDKYTHNDRPAPDGKYVQTNEYDGDSPIWKSKLPRIHSDPSQHKSYRLDNTNDKHRYSKMVLSSLEPETLNPALKGRTVPAGPPSSTHSPKKSRIPVMRPGLRTNHLNKGNCCPAFNRSFMRGTPLSLRKNASNVSLSVPPRAGLKKNAPDLNSAFGRSGRRPLSRQVPGESRSSKEKGPSQKPTSLSEPTPQPPSRRARNLIELQRDMNSSKIDLPLREYKQHVNNKQRGSQRRSNRADSTRPDDRNKPAASRDNRRGEPALPEKELGAFREQRRVRRENATRDDCETDGEKPVSLSRNTLSSFIPLAKRDQNERKAKARESQRSQKMPPVGSDENRFGEKDKMRSNYDRLKSRRLELEHVARQPDAPKDCLNMNGCRARHIGLGETPMLQTAEGKDHFKSRNRRFPGHTSDNIMKPRTVSKSGRQVVPNKFSQERFFSTANVDPSAGRHSRERHKSAKEKGGKRGQFRNPAHLEEADKEEKPSSRKKGHVADNVLFSTASSPPSKPRFSPPCVDGSSSAHHFDTSDDVSATVAFDHAGSLANQLDRTRAPWPTGRSRTRTAQKSKVPKTGLTKGR